MPLVGACNKLMRLHGALKRSHGTWGEDDVVLRKICAEKDIKYPFSNKHINIQTLFTLREGLTENASLEKAFDVYKLKMYGNQHTAAHDAYNTARIFRYML